MKVVSLSIPKYRWRVRMFFPVTRYDMRAILQSMEAIDCPEEVMNDAYRKLLYDNMNEGFTYSNGAVRCSVVVIGRYSHPAEFLNTFEHEIRHLVDNIAEAYDGRLSREDVGYLTGELNWELWPDIHQFICCCDGRDQKDTRGDRPRYDRRRV